MPLRPLTSSARDQAPLPLPHGYARLGRIVKVEAGQIAVEFEGSAGPRVARSATKLGARQLRRALATQQPVVLVLEKDDPALPIVLGLLDQGEGRTERDAKRVVDIDSSREPSPDAAPVLEADVDGKRVRLVAQDEIVLQCGEASVTLRRNGKIVLKGTYVETHSTGTNRIKGGQVRIN